MYIPSAPGSGEVVFRGGAAEEARFWEVVNAHGALKGAAGGVVGRNNAYGRWVNTFDMRLAQELPGFMKGHKASLVLDIFNFGNLLNKKWGRTDEIGFPSNRSFVNYAGRDARAATSTAWATSRTSTPARPSGRVAMGRAGDAALRVLTAAPAATHQGRACPAFFLSRLSPTAACSPARPWWPRPACASAGRGTRPPCAG
jgi:hypothetical protein